MMRASSLIGLVTAAYAVSWFLSYVYVMGFDFRYFFEYLGLAWSRPGEIPALIQVIAIVVSVVIVAVSLAIRAGFQKRQQSKVPSSN